LHADGILRCYEGKKLKEELVMEQGAEVSQSERDQARFTVTARKKDNTKQVTQEFEDPQNS